MDKFKLANGITVIVDPIDNMDITACSFFLPEGASVDSVPGTTHLSLKVGFKRTSKMTHSEFFSYLDRFSTSFATSVSTDYSFVRFQSLGSRFLDAFRLFKTVVDYPDFSEDNFNVEKSTLLATIKSNRESSFLLAYENLMALTYEGTPYQHPVIGTAERVKSLTLEEVKRRFDNLTFKKGTIFSVCGKADHVEKVLGEVESFKTSEREEVKVSKKIEEDKERVVKRKGSAQSFIMMAVNAPSALSRDYDIYKVLNVILGEGTASVLFQRIREQKGFAYSTGSFYPITVGEGRIFVYLAVSPQKEREALKEAKEILKNLPDFLNEEALKRAKEYLKGSYLMEKETRIGRTFASSLDEILRGDPNYGEKWLEKLLSLDLGELLKAAENLSKSPVHLVVVKDG